MINKQGKSSLYQAISIQQLRLEFQRELDEILSWWKLNMIDETQGGFYGRIDGHNKLHRTSNKGVILNTRLLWTFSAVSNTQNDSRFLSLANRSFDYLSDHFWDDLNSGMYWAVDYKGDAFDTQKQIYAQAFSIYALTEYYNLTKNEKAANRATEIFWMIERYSRDKEKSGYLNAFYRDWSPMQNTQLSEKDPNEAKIMNTHLHILEAYTNLYKSLPSSAVQQALEECLDLFVEKFYISENGSMHMYFDQDWNPKGDHISFGHNIEASWLLWEAVTALPDKTKRKKLLPIIIHMAEAVLKNGVAPDGSIWYEGKGETIIDTDRHWWVQAEAVVGFWNAAILTGEDKFKIASLNCFRYIQQKIKDQQNGEWFWKIDNDGHPDLEENKSGPWKAPYHNARMCMEMIKLLNKDLTEIPK